MGCEVKIKLCCDYDDGNCTDAFEWSPEGYALDVKEQVHQMGWTFVKEREMTLLLCPQHYLMAERSKDLFVL